MIGTMSVTSALCLLSWKISRTDFTTRSVAVGILSDMRRNRSGREVWSKLEKCVRTQKLQMQKQSKFAEREKRKRVSGYSTLLVCEMSPGYLHSTLFPTHIN